MKKVISIIVLALLLTNCTKDNLVVSPQEKAADLPECSFVIKINNALKYKYDLWTPNSIGGVDFERSILNLNVTEAPATVKTIEKVFYNSGKLVTFSYTNTDDVDKTINLSFKVKQIQALGSQEVELKGLDFTAPKGRKISIYINPRAAVAQMATSEIEAL
ncbi:hypothetical protein FNW52_03350 [Flavobacterium sp. ZT3R18]|uniref:hypothetical protein n=1 Tax=Flavobacterium sp. ZT3R18 TaxID=2594429 RepID=UPI00117AD793|nr:hypothetical protein [Flavobacterium sp. ZT3R18]TRX37949.1 hypothetical protein FNW52_03350 [Flavobacterium sp. ZT3R18]